MPYYHKEPPAELKEAEWEKLKRILDAAEFSQVYELLRKTENVPQRAGDLFEPEAVYSRGRDGVNRALSRSGMGLVLARINYGSGPPIPREDHLLALVRKLKEK